MDIKGQLTEFITQCQADSESATHIMQLSLLDWASVTIAGQDEPVAKIIRKQVEDEGGNEQSFAIGLARKVPARSAALINGTTSHALDYDDTHFAYLGHPSVTVFPAVLALADKLGSNISEVQRAALVGLEVTTRIGIWLGRHHYRTGFHITPTAGTFGAAAACANLLGLNSSQTRMALGLAASRASGVKEQFGTMGKPYHAGMAAAAGVDVTLLASRGFEAAQDGLAGAQGFASTHHGENNATAFDNLGTDWLYEGVSHKFHACCHGTHAMLEALEQIRDAHAFTVEEILAIEVYTHPQYLKVCNIQNPATGLEVKFSYRLIAAMYLLGIDTARPDSFNDKICMNAKAMALRKITSVMADECLSDSQARVIVKLSSGSVNEAHYDLLNLKEPHEREVKIRAKASSLLGNAKAIELWKLISGFQMPSSSSIARSLLMPR